MITFTRAATVEQGQRPTSSQLSSLSRAINDRLLSGVGDGAWRVAQWWYNLFRQVRNPDSSGYLFPALGEFFHVYQHLDPEVSGDITWPVAGPGEFEGANLGNPLNQFVFGNPDMTDEADRLSAVDLLGPAGVTGPEWYWETGKAQRGAVDPDAGLQGAPALTAAQEFMRIARFPWSPHGASYGGFFPTPTVLNANCGTDPDTPDWDSGDPGEGIPNYEIYFTALRADVSTTGLHGTITTPSGVPVCTYAGSCPCGSTQYAAGHVTWLWQGPVSYYVYVGTGVDCEYDVDVLPLADWIIGPFTGDGRLQFADGHQLDRVISAFSQDFRGSRTQRGSVPCFGDAGNQAAGSDEVRIRKVGFDFEWFLKHQYALAPNLGHLVGESDIEADYPRATWTGPQGAGSVGRFSDASTSHPYRQGFVCAGVFAKATGLAAPCTVQFLDDDEVFATLSLVPDVDGNASAMDWLADGRAVNLLSVELPIGADAMPSGLSIAAEATEQQLLKPQWWDGYLVLRLGATRGGESYVTGVDGRGTDYDASKAISDALRAYGCIVNPGVAGPRTQAEWITSNPVYDAARRLSRDHVRLLHRRNFVAYEVAGGKSILYFRRFAYGLHKDCRADLLHGIAPPVDPVTQLIPGETYLVRSADGTGTVAHNGAHYHHSETFVAETDEFTPDGDALVYVYDGIRSVAFPKRWANRWCAWIETKCYSMSYSSVYKPEAYADFYDFTDRCHFLSVQIDTALRVHATYSREVVLDVDSVPYLLPDAVAQTIQAPEAPTGYRYVGGSNQTYATDDFCRSCQIYEPPLEIESCVVDDWRDDQIVKVTFSGRFRAHEDAPATVAKDAAAWDAGVRAALAAESYRTPDNALREYSLWAATGGTVQCTVKTGDEASYAGTRDCEGTCFPTTFLVRLMPEPYDDGNDTVEKHDSRRTVDALMQAEIYTRAICEGYVDGRTTTEITCATGTGGLYDYTFENLCFDAFGGRWISSMPESIRDDNPSGFGPVVNTKPYAEVFNKLTACVNLLTKARLELPFKFEVRNHYYSGTAEIQNMLPVGVTCTTSGDMRSWADNPTLPGVTWDSDDAWIEAAGANAFDNAEFIGCPFVLYRARGTADYRVVVDPSFQYALRTELREHLEDQGSGFLATLLREGGRYDRVEVTMGNGYACYPPDDPDWFFEVNGGTHYYNWVEEPTDEEQCMMVSSGTLETPICPTSDYAFGRRASFTVDTYCGTKAGISHTLALKAAQLAYFEFALVDP